jgi:hypothetical protein
MALATSYTAMVSGPADGAVLVCIPWVVNAPWLVRLRPTLIAAARPTERPSADFPINGGF